MGDLIHHRASGTPTDFQNQLGHTLNTGDGIGKINAPLKTMTRIRAQGKPAATTLDGCRMPVSGFNKDILGAVGTGSSFTAHDAGQADGAGFVGDNAIAFIERDFSATQ